uniref:Uncharacterized protein n=1 Tax=Ditylenchus dipsaci TaxID=166011 RepID=A0A915DNN1_9BILA
MDRVSDGEQGEIDILLTRAFATGNIAANFLDNPFFNQMMNKMRLSYKLPTRKYQYSKLLIPTEFERVKRNLEEAT